MFLLFVLHHNLTFSWRDSRCYCLLHLQFFCAFMSIQFSFCRFFFA